MEYRKIRQRDWRRMREEVFHLLGHICIRCGEYDKRCLQFDHINGGGNKEIKKLSGPSGSTKYMYWLKHPRLTKQRLQILCSNYNWRKKYENDENNRTKDSNN